VTQEQVERPVRKAIPKRLRFEIFKRDHFQCVYCGRTPPVVVLEVDHMDPVAAGGTNDPSNLFTACEACNAGKSDRPLGEALPHVRAEDTARLAEKVEQMRAFREWRAKYDDELKIELNQVWQGWIDAFGGYVDDEGTYRSDRVSFPTDKVMLGYLQLPMSEILDAIGIAEWKKRKDGLYSDTVVRYFYGVLRNKARKADEEHRQIKVSWDELAESVPDLAAIRGEVAGFEPADPWNFCGSRIWTNGWTVNLGEGRQRSVRSPVDRVAALIGPRSENSGKDTLGSQTAYDLALRVIKADLPPCGQTCDCPRPKRPPREADYPRCSRCGQVTQPVDRRESCEPSSWTWDGREFEEVPYGMEPWLSISTIAENYGRYRRLAPPTMIAARERCVGCRTPVGGYHHPDCRHAACVICWERTGTGCETRSHRAPPLGVSGKQAMARLRQMKARAQPTA
jgi:hypothetical protein